MTISINGTTGITYPNSQLQAVAYLPAGMVQYFANSTVPTGWLMCDGSAVSRTTYADLFSAISTVYGTGVGLLLLIYLILGDSLLEVGLTQVLELP